jgi:hypothetical protein
MQRFWMSLTIAYINLDLLKQVCYKEHAIYLYIN